MSKGAETQIQYNMLSKENLLSKNPIQNAFIKTSFESQDFSSFYDFVEPNNSPEYTNTIQFTIPKDSADALGNISLYIQLNPLVKTSGTFACYTNTIGYAIFDYIECFIGDTLLFKKYSEECDYQFSFQKQVADESQNIMIGKYTNLAQLQNNAQDVSRYLVPIIDYLPNNSLFLFYLKHQDIKVKLKLKAFSEIVNFDGLLEPVQNKIKSIQLYNLYYKMNQASKDKISLDFIYGKKLLQIFQSQFSLYECASKLNIPFSGDTTQLTFAFRHRNAKENNDWFNYSLNGNPIIKSLTIKIDNIDLIVETDEFLLRNSNNYYKLNSSSRYIYTIPFADSLKENNDYTGSLNLRETKHLEAVIVLNDYVNSSDVQVVVFSKRYNWLKPIDNRYTIYFID